MLLLFMFEAGQLLCILSKLFLRRIRLLSFLSREKVESFPSLCQLLGSLTIPCFLALRYRRKDGEQFFPYKVTQLVFLAHRRCNMSVRKYFQCIFGVLFFRSCFLLVLVFFLCWDGEQFCPYKVSTYICVLCPLYRFRVKVCGFVLCSAYCKSPS